MTATDVITVPQREYTTEKKTFFANSTLAAETGRIVYEKHVARGTLFLLLS